MLLDVYLTEVKCGNSLTQAAEIASICLRELAERNGNILDDGFRSPSGLINRLRSIGALFEGTEAKGAPGTVVFAEAADIYKNNRPRYNELLDSANEKTTVTRIAAKKKRCASIPKCIRQSLSGVSRSETEGSVR